MLKKSVLVVLVVVLCLSMFGCSDTTTMNGSEKEKVREESTEKETAFEEVVFVDDENCTFKISDIEDDNIWGYTLKADLENKTDKNLMFSFDDVSVNGFMCDPFWATSVQAGKKAKSDISFSDSEFEELGIERVEEIEFTLSVYDEDDWMADHLVEQAYTLKID